MGFEKTITDLVQKQKGKFRDKNPTNAQKPVNFFQNESYLLSIYLFLFMFLLSKLVQHHKGTKFHNSDLEFLAIICMPEARLGNPRLVSYPHYTQYVRRGGSISLFSARHVDRHERRNYFFEKTENEPNSIQASISQETCCCGRKIRVWLAKYVRNLHSRMKIIPSYQSAAQQQTDTYSKREEPAHRELNQKPLQHLTVYVVSLLACFLARFFFLLFSTDEIGWFWLAGFFSKKLGFCLRSCTSDCTGIYAWWLATHRFNTTTRLKWSSHMRSYLHGSIMF